MPYALIWAAALFLITSSTDRSSCVGFCAVYTGWLAYGVVLAAVVLSVAVAAVELALLSR